MAFSIPFRILEPSYHRSPTSIRRGTTSAKGSTMREWLARLSGIIERGIRNLQCAIYYREPTPPSVDYRFLRSRSSFSYCFSPIHSTWRGPREAFKLDTASNVPFSYSNVTFRGVILSFRGKKLFRRILMN